MQAGRELDALVAEKAMGLNVTSHDWPCCREPECGCLEAALSLEHAARFGNLYNERGPVFVAEDNPFPNVVPLFSTDIAAAWTVVEKLKADGFCFSLINVLSSQEWEAGIHKVGVDKRFPGNGKWARASRAPHAICLAALKAAGVELSGG